jgi:plasmid stability protein
MSDLLIRNIEPELKREIEERARENRQSLSDAARALIRAGLKVPHDERKLGTLLSELVPPEYRGDDLVFEYRGEMPKPPDFE